MLGALRGQRSDWQDLAAEDLAELIATSTKRRREMANGRIRALYGHSKPGKLARAPSTPPGRLYHGLQPMAASTCISRTIAPTRWKSDDASIASRSFCS